MSSTFEFMAEAAKDKLVAAVASVKQWPVLAKATSNDDEPTPGYLFDEISTLTWTSTSDSTEVQNYLLKRLEKDAPIVKLKTLRVIKHVILKGHETFHKDLQRRFQPIKDCTQYRGPPDMLHGDAPFRLVRELAVEVMELVYENPSAIKRQVPKAILDQQMQQAASNAAMSAQPHHAPRSASATSFSSSASSMSSQGSFSSASDKSKMWGYGNPNYVEPPPSMLDKMKEKVTETLTSMAESKPSYPSNYRGNVNFSQPSSIPSKNPNIDSYAAAKNAKISYDDGPVRKAGEIGGGWDVPTSRNTPPPPPNSREPSFDPTSVPSSKSPFLETSSDTPDSYREGLLVDSITQQGGVRAAPTRLALSEFCSRAKQLNLGVVVDLLLNKCPGEPGEKMKALYVLEAMVVESLPGIESKLAENAAILQEIASTDASAAAKTKANKILLLLGMNVTAEPATPSQDSEELFAGMSVKEEPPTPPNTTDDLLGAFFQQPSKAPAAAAPSPTTSSFSFLQPQQPQPPQQQPKPQQAGSLLDFQDDPNAPSNPTAASSSQGLSLLELISQPAQPVQQPKPQAQNSASMDLLSMNDDLLSHSAALQPVTAAPKSSDPFFNLVSDTIPQGKVDLKKVPLNTLPRGSPQPTTTGFSSPFFPTSPGLINSSSSSSVIAPVTRPTAHEAKPAFSFVDSKKDAFEFVQDEIRKN